MTIEPMPRFLIPVLGLVLAGCATGNDPCDPNPCTRPPQGTCLGAVAQIYPSQGACSEVSGEAECTYVPAESDCGANGLYCHEGQCLSDPCDPNPCVAPPSDTCEGDELVTYETTGSCDAFEGEVECTYAEATRTDCADDGKACVQGACELTSDPCAPNPCNSPPVDFCSGDVLNVHPNQGICSNNAGAADCSYTPAQVDCSANGLACSDSQLACVSVADPCSPNPCTSPPANTCGANDVATQYPSTGSCTNNGGTADCTYAPNTVDCTLTGKVCQGGLCVTAGNPCDPNPCTNPPADDCTVNVANHYPSTGSCVDNAGSPECTYTPTTEDCAAASQTCSGGTCITPGTGGLIISEYVEGPSGYGDEKYIEIYNAGSSSVNLDGYKLKRYSNGATTPNATFVFPSRTLLPAGIVVVANPNASLYYASPDYRDAVIDFNGNDAMQLTDSSDQQIDIVGTIGNADVFGADEALIRNAGVVSGVTSGGWVPSEWTAQTDPENDNTLGTR